jgi:hypothetical protein
MTSERRAAGVGESGVPGRARFRLRANFEGLLREGV